MHAAVSQVNIRKNKLIECPWFLFSVAYHTEQLRGLFDFGRKHFRFSCSHVVMEAESY